MVQQEGFYLQSLRASVKLLNLLLNYYNALIIRIWCLPFEKKSVFNEHVIITRRHEHFKLINRYMSLTEIILSINEASY